MNVQSETSGRQSASDSMRSKAKYLRVRAERFDALARKLDEKLEKGDISPEAEAFIWETMIELS